MKSSRGVALGMVLAWTCVACGEDKDYGDPIEDPAAEAQARGAVASTAGLAALETDPGDEAALASVTQLYTAMQVLLNAKLATQMPSGRGLPALELAPRSGAKPFDSTCVTVAGNSVTYDACDLGTAMIDGTISWGGGTFTVNLTTSIATEDSDLTVVQRGAITITDAAIAGALSITVDGMFDAVSLDYAISSDWDIALAAGAPVAGMLEVHGAWSVRAPQGSASYDLWVKAEFDGETVTIY